jgi:hypothetical protein
MSSSSVTPAPASRSVSWSMVRGPMIADVTAGCVVTKASARWVSEQPASAAILMSSSTAASLASFPGRDGSKRCGSRRARPVVMSTPTSRRMRPVSQPPESGLQAMTPMPYFWQVGSTEASMPRTKIE